MDMKTQTDIDSDAPAFPYWLRVTAALMIFAVVVCLFWVTGLKAQNPNTAVFPGAVATDNNLLVATDNARTTLAVAINASVTSIVLTSPTKFVSPLVMTIDGEQLLCLTHTGPTYTCTRGFNGSTATNHAFLAIVQGNMTAWHHNQLAAEVKSIELLQNLRKVVYILATGQSNTVGFNDGTGEHTVNPNVLSWDCLNNVWNVMQEGVLPMGADMSLTTPGINPCQHQSGTFPNANNPTWHFAKAVQQICGCQVRVILLGWGGNSISQWVSSGALSPNYSFLHNTMIAAGVPSIDFMIWDQGENDLFGGGVDTSSCVYLSNWQTLKAQLRAESWFPPSTPIITTGLAVAANGNLYCPELSIRADATGANDPFVVFANTNALTTNVTGGAGLHWDGPSTVTLGAQIYTDALNNRRFSGQLQLLNNTETIAVQGYSVPWPDVPVLDLCSGGSADTCGGNFWVAAVPRLIHYEAGQWQPLGGAYCPAGACSMFWGNWGSFSSDVNPANSMSFDQVGGSRLLLRDGSGAARIILQGNGTNVSQIGPVVIGGELGAANTTLIDSLGGGRLQQLNGSAVAVNIIQAGGPSQIGGTLSIGGAQGAANSVLIDSAAGGRIQQLNSSGVNVNIIQAGGDNKLQSGKTAIIPTTACTGFATGTLWNNAGTLALCP